MFSKQSSWQLAAVSMETSLPFPPIVWTAGYPESFFFFPSSLGLLKLARLSLAKVSKRPRVCFIWLHYVSVQVGVCMDGTHMCASTWVSFIWPSDQSHGAESLLLSEQGWCWVLYTAEKHLILQNQHPLFSHYWEEWITLVRSLCTFVLV